MKKDNFILGSILGAIAPVIVYLLIHFNMGNLINNKPFTLYGIAVVLNLLMTRYFFYLQLTRNAQGIILITFIITMVLLFSGSLKIAI